MKQCKIALSSCCILGSVRKEEMKVYGVRIAVLHGVTADNDMKLFEPQ